MGSYIRSRALPTIEQLKEVGAIFYDFDGVMTDNRVLVNETGFESVFCNRSDGLAISEFRRLGIHQVIISTETNPAVVRRAEKLKIPVIHKLDSTNVDKGQVLEKYADENGIKLSYSIFIGNDINDLPALKLVAYPGCPNDAEEEVRSFCERHIKDAGKGWISTRNGGYGVVRELMRTIMLSASVTI